MNILATYMSLLALSGLTLAKLDMAKICQNNNLGDVIANPVDCNSYIVCESAAPLIQHCENDLHFDAKRKVCNWPAYAGCSLAQPSSPDTDAKDPIPHHPEFIDDLNIHFTPLSAIDIMTGDVIDSMIAYNPQEIVCRHFGAYFLPHPLKCRSYILCAYGHIHQHSCGLGSMWSYKKQQCEISVKAECYAKTAEEAKEMSASISVTTDNPLMVCFSLDSSSTTTTSDGLPTNTWHPTGSIYNATANSTQSSTTAMGSSAWTGYSPTPEVSSTESAIQSSSSSSSSPVLPTKAPTKTPNSDIPLVLECPNKNQSYLAHPRDCSKYYMCIMGMPILTSCPAGLYWDSKMEYCDLAKNVKCFQ